MPIVPTLRWAPLVRRSDLAQPAGFVSDFPRGAGDGYQLNVPRFLGSNTMGVTRASFPKSVSEWGLVAPVDACMSHDFVPQLSFGNYAPVTGPYDKTAWQVEPTSAFGHNCDIDVKWSLGDASQDRYDYASYKRSMACVIKAATEEDVGKIVRVNAVDKNDVPGGSGWWSGPYDIEHVDVELTLQWQSVVITFQNQEQFDGITPTLVISMPSADAPLCQYIAAAYTSANWHAHETDDASNWLRPLPFHESLGLLSQFQHRNSWGPDFDDPFLYGGAAKASSSMNAPDDARFYGGRTMNLYTVPIEGGFTTDAPYRCEHLGDVYPSNEATGAVWLNVYVRPQSEMPSDGDLVGYVTARRLLTTSHETTTRPGWVPRQPAKYGMRSPMTTRLGPGSGNPVLAHSRLQLRLWVRANTRWRAIRHRYAARRASRRELDEFASITWSTDDPTRLPAFQAFDVAVAWRNDRLVAFGLGEGEGTRISWLENGDTYQGGLVQIGYEVARTWDLADADSHIGLGADRDRIRQFGGWIQAIVASESVDPDALTVKTWIEAIISYPGGWGPRLDYR